MPDMESFGMGDLVVAEVEGGAKVVEAMVMSLGYGLDAMAHNQYEVCWHDEDGERHFEWVSKHGVAARDKVVGYAY